MTFLPLLAEPCSFDLLVYADAAASVPLTWEDSDPCYIEKAEEVRLRSFTTKVMIYLFIYLFISINLIKIIDFQIHKVDAMVSYRLDEEAI